MPRSAAWKSATCSGRTNSSPRAGTATTKPSSPSRPVCTAASTWSRPLVSVASRHQPSGRVMPPGRHRASASYRLRQHGGQLCPVEQAHRPACGCLRSQAVGPRDAYRAAAGGNAVAEPAVDTGLARPQRREHLTAGGSVVELGTDQRREHPPPGPVGPHPHTADRSGGQDRAAGHRGAHRERHGGAHERPVVVHAEGAPGLVEPPPLRPPLVGGRRLVDGRGEQVVRGAQLVRVEDPDGVEVRVQTGRPTS